MNFLSNIETQSFLNLLPILFQILKNWWWFFLTIILLYPSKLFYLWWINWEVWYKKNKWILIEIKPPAEVLKPFKAMEDVIHSLWGVYDSPKWREVWCEGEFQHDPYWFSLEIASFGGDVRFYIRILEEWKDTFEAAIYAYYPEAEISVVEDYTKNVPQNIPNKDWDLYSEDYTLMRDEIYPIRTYSTFFEEKPDVPLEEKRLDPMYSFLEALGKLQSGEQIWLQIVAAPTTNNDNPWITHGKAIANKLARRPELQKQKGIFQEAEETVSHVVTGTPPPAPQKEEGFIAPELRLTPGEKEVLSGVERKISKQGFKTWIRQVYVCKKDEPHNFGTYKIIRTYLMSHFMTENLNSLIYYGPTRSKIHYWLRGRRLYMRKRKQFRHYIERFPPYFPWNLKGEPFPHFLLDLIHYPLGPGIRGTCILNAEELATIYHFPPKIIVPTVQRVEEKRAGPPSELPVEEEKMAPPSEVSEE